MTIAELADKSPDAAFVLVPKFWRHDGFRGIRLLKASEIGELFAAADREQDLRVRSFEGCLALQLPRDRRDYCLLIACHTKEGLLRVLKSVIEVLSAHERTVRDFGG